MRYIIITNIFLILSSNCALAHKCILGGNNAESIMVYNTCKNDLATGVAGHNKTVKTDAIAELERENEKLKTRILFLKKHLLELLEHID